MLKSFIHVLIGLIFLSPFKTVKSQHYQHLDEERKIDRHLGYQGKYRKRIDNNFWIRHFYSDNNPVKVTPDVFKKVCSPSNLDKPVFWRMEGERYMRMRCKQYSKNISLERLIYETGMSTHEVRDFDYVVRKFCEKVMEDFFPPRSYFREDWTLRCVDNTLDDFVKYAKFGFYDSSSSHEGSMWESMKKNHPNSSLEKLPKLRKYSDFDL